MDRSRYRYVSFIGGRILQAREMDKLQDITRGVDDNNLQTAFALDALYREGATFNVSVTVTPNTKTVTVGPVNGAQPMLVFVRGRWEILKSGEAPVTTLTTEQGTLYLNWQLKKITFGVSDGDTTDSALKDLTTNEAAAEMGELRMALSPTDDSARAADASEFEKNLVAIPVFSFIHTSTSVTLNAQSNVRTQAHASSRTAGMVQTTTDSAVVASTDDTRLSDARAPLAASVTNAKVRMPLQDGSAVNADGTPRFDLTRDAGGIDTAKIVHQVGTQRLDDTIEAIKSNAAALAASIETHEGAHLGGNTTHPFPTATEVGATPASHQSAGLDAAHGLSATRNTDGFSVTRDKAVVPTTGNAAFAVKDQDGDLVKLTHDGDVYSKLAAAFSAPAISGLTGGALGLLSAVAHVLSSHSNAKGSGTATATNPHGLTLTDLGWVNSENPGEPPPFDLTPAYTYADNVGAAAETHADLLSTISVRTDGTCLNWVIISFGSPVRFELAIGTHAVPHGQLLQLPAGFSTNNMLATAACGSVNFYCDPGEFTTLQFGVDPSNQVLASVSSGKRGLLAGNANVTAVAWRML